MKLLGKKSFNGRDYDIQDTKGFLNLEDFDLPVDFYGGRIQKVAVTDIPGVYMLVGKHKVVDMMIVLEEYEDPENQEVVYKNQDGEEISGDDEVPNDYKGNTGEGKSDPGIPFSEDDDYHSYTNKELTAMLEQLGIEVPSKAVKAELVELLEEAIAQTE